MNWPLFLALVAVTTVVSLYYHYGNCYTWAWVRTVQAFCLADVALCIAMLRMEWHIGEWGHLLSTVIWFVLLCNALVLKDHTRPDGTNGTVGSGTSRYSHSS